MLDLFCGAGGCSTGYSRAGFEVVGVDIGPQKRYPFEFVQADALEYLAEHGHEFDVIHASPPCQAYSAMGRMVPTAKPKLIVPLRQLLLAVGKPYVIENVEGAELQGNVVTLCGTMFGLRVRRHRLFEINPDVLILTPGCCCRRGVATGRLIGHRVAGRVRGNRKPPPACDGIGSPRRPGVPLDDGERSQTGHPARLHGIHRKATNRSDRTAGGRMTRARKEPGKSPKTVPSLRALSALAFLFSAAVSGAPAPQYREKPPPCVVPGTHTLHWSGTPWRMTIDAEGRYESVREGSPRYYGSWAWCPMRRIFAIHETIDGQTWQQWTITLDDKLSGKADQVGCPEVRVEPIGKRKERGAGK